jgi:hypothetical protein
MTETPLPTSSPARPLRRALIIASLFFVGGIGLTGWFLTRTEIGANLLTQQEPSPLTIDASKLNVPAIAPPPSDQMVRIAELEARVARAEAAVTSGASAGAAPSNRINGLILAFAARRALDRGQALGPVEAELKAQFGASKPHLVAAVVAAAAEPTTLDQIQTEFAAVAPSLSSDDGGWWSRLKAGLSGLVSIRSASTKSNDPAQLLDHAQKALAAGRVGEALGDVVNLPNRSAASAWMNKARRYAEAQRALDALEASAFDGEAVPPPPQIVPPLPAPPVPAAPDAQGNTGTF